MRRSLPRELSEKHVCVLQPFNEGEEDGLPEGEERMEILEQQAQPSDRPRITTRYMTKYERARILGTRALQIRCALAVQHNRCMYCAESRPLCARPGVF